MGDNKKGIKIITGKNLVKIRGVLSSLLLVISFILIFTGIGLFFAPSGRIARETGWSYFGIDLLKLETLHKISGFVMAGLIVIHFILNYKIFKNEIKQVFNFKK